MSDRTCTIDGCPGKHYARGWCHRHWKRWCAHGDPLYRRPTALDRYWSKVDTSGGPDSCWPWTEALFDSGYGHFWDGKRSVRAHRWGYQQRVGPIPVGLCVLHRCDNPPCQNDRHWFLGTNADNTADMFSKDRQHDTRGESAGIAKLSEAKVREIRTKFAAGGVSHQRLADEFGVSRATVTLLINGRTWAHVT